MRCFTAGWGLRQSITIKHSSLFCLQPLLASIPGLLQIWPKFSANIHIFTFPFLALLLQSEKFFSPKRKAIRATGLCMFEEQHVNDREGKPAISQAKCRFGTGKEINTSRALPKSQEATRTQKQMEAWAQAWLWTYVLSFYMGLESVFPRKFSLFTVKN